MPSHVDAFEGFFDVADCVRHEEFCGEDDFACAPDADHVWCVYEILYSAVRHAAAAADVFEGDAEQVYCS